MERLNDIIELLESIRVQTYPHLETIVVIEKSNELLDHIKRYAMENIHPPVRVVFNSGEPGLSAARNLGVTEANGGIIAFVDDDALLAPDWAEEMMKTYEDDSIIGVTGAISPLWQDGNGDWFPAEFDWILGATGFSNLNGVREVRNVFGANMSFRKKAFEESGLFLTKLGAKGGGGGLGNQKFASEDTEFSMRVRRKTKKRLIFNPNVRVKHKVHRYRITQKFIARRAYSEGYTKAMFNQNYRKIQKKPLYVESNLLKRIFTRLFPRIFRGFFTHPVTAWRQLALTVNALLFVAIGYLSFTIRQISGREKTTIQLQEFVKDGMER
jgi:glycosyltransferase involved in cell wall biosynthesis